MVSFSPNLGESDHQSNYQAVGQSRFYQTINDSSPTPSAQPSTPAGKLEGRRVQPLSASQEQACKEAEARMNRRDWQGAALMISGFACLILFTTLVLTTVATGGLNLLMAAGIAASGYTGFKAISLGERIRGDLKPPVYEMAKQNDPSTRAILIDRFALDIDALFVAQDGTVNNLRG